MTAASLGGAARTRLRRRRASVALGVVLAVVISILAPATAAQAKKVYPTTGDIANAKAKAAHTRSAVSKLEKQITSADDALTTLQNKAEVASQLYDAALAKLDQAKASAASTEAAAVTAQAAFDESQTELGVFAADSYRSGGDLANVGALLTADGPGTLLDRANTISVLSTQREQVLERVQSARVVADLLDQQAQDALLTVQTATQTVADTQKQAQDAFAQQKLEVKTLDGQKATLRTQLTKLDKHAAALFQKRTEGIAAAKAAREAAAARKAALKRGATDGSGGLPPNVPNGVSVSTKAEAAVAVAFAKAQLGKWYQWGGAGPSRFDCSGLTMRAWEKAGVTIPRVASWQYAAIEKISLNSLRPGDLVFYATDLSDYTSIHHVGMYVGNGQMIEAPHTGAKIRYASIWRPDLFGAGRP